MANREKQTELAEIQRKELDSIAARNHEEAKERQREVDGAAALSTKAKSASGYEDEDMTSTRFESDNVSHSDPNDINGLNTKADFSIDDVQTIDICDDLDKSINKYMRREPTEPPNRNGIPEYRAQLDIKVEPETEFPTPVASRWKSQMHPVHFRATSEQVADDYLVQHNHVGWAQSVAGRTGWVILNI